VAGIDESDDLNIMDAAWVDNNNPVIGEDEDRVSFEVTFKSLVPKVY
jgi:hypothetical protein